MHGIDQIGIGMFSYGHEDFDGAVDAGDNRSGVGRSEAECKKLIDSYWDNIDWMIGEQLQVLGTDWAAYSVTGEDDNGHEYKGIIHSFISDSKIEGKVMDIKTN